MQIGRQRQRLRPIRPDLVFAAQGAAGVKAEPLDKVRGHLEVVRIKREHTLKVTGIPARDPFAPERGQIGGCVTAGHGFPPSLIKVNNADVVGDVHAGYGFSRHCEER